MPPVGFKRSRALWDNARRPHGHWSAAVGPWCRAVLYELQPVRRSQLPDMRLVQQRLVAAVWILVRNIPSTCQAVTTWIGQRSRREWMWLTAALAYYAAVRWIHSVLEAGPVVLIITALVAIFTIGLSDEGNADGISAYAVFNRGFRRLLGTVEADDLVAQHMGGGGMRMPLQQQEEDNNILQAPLPPRRRAAAAEAPPNPDDAPGAAEDNDDENENNNNDNQNNVNDDNQPRRRLPGKKASRRNLEQRRELQRQREAARAMGFDDENEQGEALALQRLLDQENE